MLSKPLDQILQLRAHGASGQVNWLLGVLIVLFILLQYQLWVGEGNLVEVQRLRAAIETQQAENKRLLARNKALDAEVRDLKEGLAAVEERARNELGMVKEGETFYQIVE
jgi:cell division protein FtsB